MFERFIGEVVKYREKAGLPPFVLGDPVLPGINSPTVLSSRDVRMQRFPGTAFPEALYMILR
jgi:hypothetical protein